MTFRRWLAVLPVMLAGPAAVAVGLLVLESAPVTFILFHGMVCLLIPLTAMIRSGKPVSVFLRETGLVFPRREVILSLWWGAAAFAVTFSLFSLLHHRIWTTSGITAVLSRWNVGSLDPLSFALVMVVGNAFLEELFWRGYCVKLLGKRLSRKGIILLTSAFYASYHGITTGILFSFPFALASFSLVFLAGAVWCSVRLRTDSLAIPIVTHLFLDAAIIAVYFTHLT